MLPETDRQALRDAGIDDLEALEVAAAQFVREHPLYPTPVMLGALTAPEEDYLREGGAVGVDQPDLNSIARNITRVAGEYAAMVAAADSQKAAAERLGVSTSRIRQKIREGSLYAINGAGGRVCPRWQFHDGSTLPGLERVLAAISKDAHPVAVQRFFLTVSPDLESPTLGTPLSPRDWLATGHPVENVVLLAQAL